MIRPVTVPRPVPALLSFVAGYVDSIIFLGLFGIFVAQTTGSFVLAGTQFVSQEHGLAVKLLGSPIFFLSGCVEPVVRSAEEMRLLRLWYDIVTDGRPRGYSFDDAVVGYRRSVLYCNLYNVIAIGSLDAANARGMAVFTGWLRRRGAAIEELDAAELMPR